MSCISWNCRGLGNPRTIRALNDLLKDHNPELRVHFGFDSCFLVDKVGRSGGLAVLLKRSMQCEITGYSNHHIDALFLENGHASWRLTCFYGYPERTRRRNSWDLIRNLANISSLPWCIWGDFNDLLLASDKKGFIHHPQFMLDGFGRAIEDCQLSELSMSGGKFTWEKSRGYNAWVREKLDRGFANSSWWNKFPMYSFKLSHTSVSDHEPILLELLKADISKKTFRFRFENMWLRDPNFVKEVTDVWKTIPILHLLPKLFEVSSFMAR
ncbi:uncharacterized protein LOC141701372 [Apium graveolens]|uniref:uncharacterized protein LOC141701372 n=1 Tax=Apium graveolens TaxID=4045 RepID=UPI003D78BA64